MIDFLIAAGNVAWIVFVGFIPALIVGAVYLFFFIRLDNEMSEREEAMLRRERELLRICNYWQSTLERSRTDMREHTEIVQSMQREVAECLATVYETMPKSKPMPSKGAVIKYE